MLISMGFDFYILMSNDQRVKNPTGNPITIKGKIVKIEPMQFLECKFNYSLKCHIKCYYDKFVMYSKYVY